MRTPRRVFSSWVQWNLSSTSVLNNDLEENKRALLVKFKNEMRAVRIQIGKRTNHFFNIWLMWITLKVAKTGLQNLIRYGDNTEEKRKGRKEIRIWKRAVEVYFKGVKSIVG